MALISCVSASIPAFLPVVACGANEACSPEKFDLGGATRVVPTSLAQATEQSCDQAGVSVVSDSAQLSALLAKFGDAGLDASATPRADFSSQRIVALRHLVSQGVSWTVVDGDKIVFGLLGCSGTVDLTNCTVDVYRVAELISSGETRTCDPVNCGLPTISP